MAEDYRFALPRLVDDLLRNLLAIKLLVLVPPETSYRAWQIQYWNCLLLPALRLSLYCTSDARLATYVPPAHIKAQRAYYCCLQTFKQGLAG
jgi:hypothetical protein